MTSVGICKWQRCTDAMKSRNMLFDKNFSKAIPGVKPEEGSQRMHSFLLTLWTLGLGEINID